MTLDNNQGLIYNSQNPGQPGFSLAVNSSNPFNNSGMNFAQGLASKTYNDTIGQYSAQAGVPIGTGPAAAIYGQGIGGIAGAMIGFGYCKYKKHDHKKTLLYTGVGAFVGFIAGKLAAHTGVVTVK
jgi:hypothetical protein